MLVHIGCFHYTRISWFFKSGSSVGKDFFRASTKEAEGLGQGKSARMTITFAGWSIRKRISPTFEGWVCTGICIRIFLKDGS